MTQVEHPMSSLPALQPLRELLESHRTYRAHTLNLIASENVMSPAVEALFTPALSHRYGDYTGTDTHARKYTGNKYLVDIDAGAQEAVRTLFGCGFADLRPLSGHIAGVAALLALCRPGDTVLELDSPGGGHRLAQKLSVATLCPLRVLPLALDPEMYTVDAAQAAHLIRAERPKLVILGSSLFLFPHPVAPLAEAVHAAGGHLLFDASHVLGLIAGGAYPNPLREGADLLTSSTHKTFAGPQGGLLLTDDSEMYERVAPAIYPALVTNHHLHRLPALWAACEEWRGFGHEHAQAVVANAQALGAALDAQGMTVVGKPRGYTESHTVLIAYPDAKAAAVRLEAAGILVTPVGLPAALGGACLRLGVQEVTRRGMRPGDASAVAGLIAMGLSGEDVSGVVGALAAGWTECRFTWTEGGNKCAS